MADTITFPRPDGDSVGFITLSIVGAKFLIMWGRDYYANGRRRSNNLITCAACGGLGKIALLDNSACGCPRCDGDGRCKSGEIEYYPVALRLHRVTVTAEGARLFFDEPNASLWSGNAIGVNSADFATMRVTPYNADDPDRHIYETREEAQAEADRLNAQSAERSNDESDN